MEISKKSSFSSGSHEQLTDRMFVYVGCVLYWISVGMEITVICYEYENVQKNIME